MEKDGKLLSRPFWSRPWRGGDAVIVPGLRAGSEQDPDWHIERSFGKILSDDP
jgi:hypothetical protein